MVRKGKGVQLRARSVDDGWGDGIGQEGARHVDGMWTVRVMSWTRPQRLLHGPLLPLSDTTRHRGTATQEHSTPPPPAPPPSP